MTFLEIVRREDSCQSFACVILWRSPICGMVSGVDVGGLAFFEDDEHHTVAEEGVYDALKSGRIGERSVGALERDHES
jgi:hypothetical protein